MKTNNTLKEWWIPVLTGIALVFISIFFMMLPLETFLVFTILFGWMIFANGGFNTVFAIRNRHVFERWYLFLIIGLLEMVIGAVMLFQPELSANTLILFTGFWLTFSAITRIVLSFWMKKEKVSNWWLLLISGIILLIFSISILINPLIGIISIVYLVSIPIFVTGVMSIIFCFQLKKLIN